jgi:dihydrolipoamide dehydrogenase
MKKFDITIIGGGESGYSAARQAADLGAKVCLVERNVLGGSILNNGIFSLRKVLTALGKFPQPQKLEEVAENDLQLDIGKIFDKANTLSKAYSEKWKSDLEVKGVHLEIGEGSFVEVGKVEVKTLGGVELISSEKIILATGSSPKHPDTIPFDKEMIVPLEELTRFRELPEKVLIMDGGAHGCEMASLIRVLGCKPFLCEKGSRILPDQAPEIMDFFESQIRKKKLKLILNKGIKSIFKNGESIDVSLDGGLKFPISKILFGGTRTPISASLNIESSGIRKGEFGEILSDEKMETSLPGVFAIGSLIRNQRILGKNYEEAKVSVYNCLGKARELNVDRIPFIIHSDPEVGVIGCHLENAHHKGFRAIGASSTLEGFNADGSISQNGLLKLTIERESRKLIGAQIVAPNVSKMLPFVSLAIKKGLTIKDIANFSVGVSDSFLPIVDTARKILNDLKKPR